MTPHDDTPQPPPAAMPAPAAASTPAAAPAPAPAAETAPLSLAGFESLARELLRQQRSDRRWRLVFRLAWLGLAVARR